MEAGLSGKIGVIVQFLALVDYKPEKESATILYRNMKETIAQ